MATKIKTVVIDVLDSITFTIEFIIARPLRRNHRSIHTPKTTQCLVYQDGLLLGFGTVVKHENDVDNQDVANVNAAKIAFQNAFPNSDPDSRAIRTELWKALRK